MKILYLPVNIASIPTNTAKAIKKLPGISVKCLMLSSHQYQDTDDTVIVLPDKGSKKNIIRWAYRYFKNIKTIKRLIDEADILHYVWGAATYGELDLKWARHKKKPIFIEWLGSDIRNPGLLFPINKYYKNAFNNAYEYKSAENSNHKINVQKNFHKVNATAVACPEISLFINRDLFPKVPLLFQRLNVAEFEPSYKPVNKKLLLLHSPTAEVAKGTKIILKTIEKLKLKYDFDFVLMKNVSRKEVLSLMKQADVFIDQIILGGYGMAAVEAMAFGKPVMCYVMPEVFKAGLPEECPLVNTNPDNIETQLEKLITNNSFRYETGIKSRAYVEKYHDADKISLQLAEMYKQELMKNLKYA